jgi:hypothetical protein
VISMKDDMDVAGYDRGVFQMPQRLRSYAYGAGGVTLELNAEQAVLLADDIEVGIGVRIGGKDESPEKGYMTLPDRLRVYAKLQDRIEMTLHQELALKLAGDIEAGLIARNLQAPS